MKTHGLKLSVLLITSALLLPVQGWSKTESEYNAEIIKLEKKLKKLDKKDKKRNRSIVKKINKQFERLKFNGFASAGLSSSDVDAVHVTQINDTKNYQADAVIGFQTTFLVNEKTQAILQLVGRGIERNDVEAEWAYLSHDFTPNLTVRAGRLRIPTYNLSEILEVGYAYPWTRPVPEIYNQAPFTSYYGVDFFYNTPFLLGTDLQIQGMNGTDALSAGSISFTAQTMYAAYATLTKGPLAVRLGAFTATSSIGLGDPADLGDLTAIVTNPVLATLSEEQLTEYNEQFGTLLSFNGIRTDFYSVGVMFDNGVWVAHLEGAALKQKGIFNSNSSFYGTLGRRFNQWMPFVVFAKQYTEDETIFGKVAGPLIPPLLNAAGFDPQKHVAYSLGIRYDIQAGIALKLQLDHHNDFEDTRGNFNSLPGDDAQIFSFTVDAVF